jgi:transposase InsO family protein
MSATFACDQRRRTYGARQAPTSSSLIFWFGRGEHVRGVKAQVRSRSKEAPVGKVDDHSRLLADGRFFAHENARACQDLLRRAITRRGLPEVFYADNGAPFSNAWLARTCAVLGIRLVHSRPYSPP